METVGKVDNGAAQRTVSLTVVTDVQAKVVARKQLQGHLRSELVKASVLTLEMEKDQVQKQNQPLLDEEAGVLVQAQQPE
jgi:hypothetical protein